MQRFRTLMAVLLAFILALSTSTAAEQRHAVAPTELAEGVAQHVAKQDADRAVIEAALSKPEVQEVADRAGVSASQLQSAVANLHGETLEQAATAARDVNQALVGGASTITFSTTTIIIILLVVILIIVAVD